MQQYSQNNNDDVKIGDNVNQGSQDKIENYLILINSEEIVQTKIMEMMEHELANNPSGSNYLCPYCPGGFNTSDTYTRHLNRVHPGKFNQTTKYDCNICGISCISRRTFHVHCWIKHGVTSSQSCRKFFYHHRKNIVN